MTTWCVTPLVLLTLSTVCSIFSATPVVAHNPPFDMRFLNHEIGRVYGEYRLANPCLCTVQLSRKLLPDIENHKLKTVAEHYSISLVNHHRASDDAGNSRDIRKSASYAYHGRTSGHRLDQTARFDEVHMSIAGLDP